MWTDNAIFESQVPSNRNPNTRQEKPFGVVGNGHPRDARHYRLPLLSLIAPQWWKASPYCRRLHALRLLGWNWLVLSEDKFSQFQKAHLSSQRREATNTYDSYEQQQRPADTLLFAVFGLDRVSHLPVTPQVILPWLINPAGKDSPKCAGNGGNNHRLSSAQAAGLSFPFEEILITNHSAAGIYL